MDYETKSPSKAMGVSLMPVYGVVASLATLALLIISKDLWIYRLICDRLVMIIKRKWVGIKFYSSSFCIVIVFLCLTSRQHHMEMEPPVKVS